MSDIHQEIFIGLVSNPVEGKWVILPIDEDELEEVIKEIAPNGEEVFIPDTDGPINGEFYDIKKFNNVIEYAELKDLDEWHLQALFEYFGENLDELWKYFENETCELRIWDLRDYFPNYNYPDRSEEQIWADLADVWVNDYGYLGVIPDQAKRHINYHSVGEQIQTECDIHMASNGIVIEVIE